jgi:hypothetical protein
MRRTFFSTALALLVAAAGGTAVFIAYPNYPLPFSTEDTVRIATGSLTEIG